MSPKLRNFNLPIFLSGILIAFATASIAEETKPPLTTEACLLLKFPENLACLNIPTPVKPSGGMLMPNFPNDVTLVVKKNEQDFDLQLKKIYDNNLLLPPISSQDPSGGMAVPK